MLPVSSLGQGKHAKQRAPAIRSGVLLVLLAAVFFISTSILLYLIGPDAPSLAPMKHRLHRTAKLASNLMHAAKSKVASVRDRSASVQDTLNALNRDIKAAENAIVAAKSSGVNSSSFEAHLTELLETKTAFQNFAKNPDGSDSRGSRSSSGSSSSSSSSSSSKSGGGSLANLFGGKQGRNKAAALAHLSCRDTDPNCKLWAEEGECEKNPGFMRPNCPKACDACMDAEKRQKLCHRTSDVLPLLKKGGVDRTFRTLVGELTRDGFQVDVLSQPPRGPWIVTIDDFLREHEIRALMEKGGHHFERSLAGDGVSAVRTSKTSWCNVPFCEADPTIRSIKMRVANATGVPLANSEHIQVLKYDEGDFYKQHHDQNAHKHSPWGPRLYTFFQYLSDVPAGGGTRFTELNLTVEAKRGRALMWPSVYDSDPSAIRFQSDHRTQHEALTVTKGQKFAANMWLHQFDFQNTLAAGCKNEDLAAWRPSDPDAADDPPDSMNS